MKMWCCLEGWMSWWNGLYRNCHSWRPCKGSSNCWL
jgi:hypothetical protein